MPSLDIIPFLYVWYDNYLYMFNENWHLTTDMLSRNDFLEDGIRNIWVDVDSISHYLPTRDSIDKILALLKEGDELGVYTYVSWATEGLVFLEKQDRYDIFKLMLGEDFMMTREMFTAWISGEITDEIYIASLGVPFWEDLTDIPNLDFDDYLRRLERELE